MKSLVLLITHGQELILKINNQQKNYTDKLLENLENANYTFLSWTWTTFGVLGLADMQTVSNCNKGIWFLLHAIDVFSKYVWVVPLKGKKGNTITQLLMHLRRA